MSNYEQECGNAEEEQGSKERETSNYEQECGNIGPISVSVLLLVVVHFPLLTSLLFFCVSILFLVVAHFPLLNSMLFFCVSIILLVVAHFPLLSRAFNSMPLFCVSIILLVVAHFLRLIRALNSMLCTALHALVKCYTRRLFDSLVIINRVKVEASYCLNRPPWFW